ncbi:hypothetical protein [Novosphingobium sp.]|uniref:hypothetical protein n=1 Tax=Novosphingobium sp. TaxID=1874826 RepID=UPI00286AD2D7|nr:hypothetical protein [Novosphingobium sp.]
MTVRIEEMTHIPAPTGPAQPGANPPAPAASGAADPAILVAAIRRENDRCARLWAD